MIIAVKSWVTFAYAPIAGLVSAVGSVLVEVHFIQAAVVAMITGLLAAGGTAVGALLSARISAKAMKPIQEDVSDVRRASGLKRRDHDAGHVDKGDRVPDAIVLVDMATSEIAYVNEGVFALLGYIPAELTGHSVEVLVPEENRGVHMRERADYASAPHSRLMGNGMELFARTKEGHAIPVEISLHPLGDGHVMVILRRRSGVARLVH